MIYGGPSGVFVLPLGFVRWAADFLSPAAHALPCARHVRTQPKVDAAEFNLERL
jgi:hypothetical protein